MAFQNPFDLVCENVKLHPNHVLFGDSEQVLSGKESLDLIDNIAFSIHTHLAPEAQDVGIAILLPRNNLYLATIFAVWQLGHYFIPLNDRWPLKHLQSVLKKANPHLVISQKSVEGVNTLSLDSFNGAPSLSENTKNVWIEKRRIAKRAYLIFTSGSTGEQKGVIISHEAYRSYLEWVQRYFIHHSKNRSLLITAELTFDITMGDIAFALAHDTEIHVSPDPRNIVWHAKLMMERKIDTFYSVPSTINRLFSWVQTREDVDFNHVKLVVSGGDAFAPDLISLVKQVSSNAEFHNVYGPTEVTINCLATRVDHLQEKIAANGNQVPIGLPFQHLTTMIWTENGDIQYNETASGELLVGGKQCMDGYIGDTNLTEKAFIIKNGTRYYRTGDLVKTDEDGYYYVISRIDSLVKVKGYRINPIEIDNFLSGDPRVKEAKTITFREEEHTENIVSFVTLYQSGKDIQLQLLEQCRTSLPDYMIPYNIVEIDQIPTGSSGKYDGKRLKSIYLENFNKPIGEPLSERER